VAESLICMRCGRECKEYCEAHRQLERLYRDIRAEEKTEIMRKLREQLDLVDCEVADDLKVLAERIIDRFPELHFIRDYEIKVGYVRSYEKKGGRKILYADCRKVSGTYKAFLPYDYIITFYDYNVSILNENQQKILMLHELKHIEVGPKGLGIRPHDIEDFRDILQQYGLEWTGYDQEVPDILEKLEGDGNERVT
jgi:predicted metallopeptidase